MGAVPLPIEAFAEAVSAASRSAASTAVGIAAWETHDKESIRRTWKEVQRVALEYGVIP